MFRIAILLITAGHLTAQKVTMVDIQPLDIKRTGAAFDLSAISQLASRGSTIYIRSARDTNIVAIHQNGNFQYKLGSQGDHPSEFGHYGVMTMALDNDGLWAMDMQGRRMRHFENGSYVDGFRPPLGPRVANLTSQVFAASKDFLVLQSLTGSDHLADVFDHRGNHVQVVGELLPDTDTFGAGIRNYNATLWQYDQGLWYCLFAFAPEVRVFDHNFQWVNAFEVQSPVIRNLREALSEPDGLGSHIFEPVFTDFKLYKGQILAMSGGTLHRIDARSGKVRDLVRFRGKGPDFQNLTQPWVHLPFFTVLPRGRLVLGHPAMLWNHELWIARLPWHKS